MFLFFQKNYLVSDVCADLFNVQRATSDCKSGRRQQHSVALSTMCSNIGAKAITRHQCRGCQGSTGPVQRAANDVSANCGGLHLHSTQQC